MKMSFFNPRFTQMEMSTIIKIDLANLHSVIRNDQLGSTTIKRSQEDQSEQYYISDDHHNLLVSKIRKCSVAVYQYCKQNPAVKPNTVFLIFLDNEDDSIIIPNEHSNNSR